MTTPKCPFARAHKWVGRPDSVREVERCSVCGYYRERLWDKSPGGAWLYVSPHEKRSLDVLRFGMAAREGVSQFTARSAAVDPRSWRLVAESSHGDSGWCFLRGWLEELIFLGFRRQDLRIVEVKSAGWELQLFSTDEGLALADAFLGLEWNSL